MDIKSILEEDYYLNDIYIEQINYGLIDRNYKVVLSQGILFFKIYNSISSIAFKKLDIPVPVEVI